MSPNMIGAKFCLFTFVFNSRVYSRRNYKIHMVDKWCGLQFY